MFLCWKRQWGWQVYCSIVSYRFWIKNKLASFKEDNLSASENGSESCVTALGFLPGLENSLCSQQGSRQLWGRRGGTCHPPSSPTSPPQAWLLHPGRGNSTRRIFLSQIAPFSTTVLRCGDLLSSLPSDCPWNLVPGFPICSGTLGKDPTAICQMGCNKASCPGLRWELNEIQHEECPCLEIGTWCHIYVTTKAGHHGFQWKQASSPSRGGEGRSEEGRLRAPRKHKKAKVDGHYSITFSGKLFPYRSIYIATRDSRG